MFHIQFQMFFKCFNAFAHSVEVVQPFQKSLPIYPHIPKEHHYPLVLFPDVRQVNLFSDMRERKLILYVQIQHIAFFVPCVLLQKSEKVSEYYLFPSMPQLILRLSSAIPLLFLCFRGGVTANCQQTVAGISVEYR